MLLFEIGIFSLYCSNIAIESHFIFQRQYCLNTVYSLPCTRQCKARSRRYLCNIGVENRNDFLLRYLNWTKTPRNEIYCSSAFLMSSCHRKTDGQYISAQVLDALFKKTIVQTNDVSKLIFFELYGVLSRLFSFCSYFFPKVPPR